MKIDYEDVANIYPELLDIKTKLVFLLADDKVNDNADLLLEMEQSLKSYWLRLEIYADVDREKKDADTQNKYWNCRMTRLYIKYVYDQLRITANRLIEKRDSLKASDEIYEALGKLSVAISYMEGNHQPKSLADIHGGKE